MLTAIDGKGESTQHERSVQINDAGLIDISTAHATFQSDPHRFESAINELNVSCKKRLYKGLQKEIATCLRNTSNLLKRKNELLKTGDDAGAETADMKYKELCHRERLIWPQIKMLYKIINAG